jgi:Sensors of blue-light using FAD
VNAASTIDLHFVFISRLAAGRDATTFDDICRHANTRNPERRIAGVLVFDGERFVQWVYGPRVEVRRLMGAIVLDARHTALGVRLEAMLPAHKLELEPRWRSGWVSPDALDGFATLRRTDGAGILTALGRLIDQAELDAPLGVPPSAAQGATPRADGH